MRKVTSVLAILLIAILVCGTVAYAADLRTYRQKGYDVEIEYYANTADMFMYLLYDKDYNLIAVGLDNEGCFVYGEWDHETGGVKQALNEYGEEYVVGVHTAPASSKLYPIPDIAYVARAQRVAEFEAANQFEEIEEPTDGITYGEYMELKAQAQNEGAAFSASYVSENKGKLKAQSVSSATSAPEDMWHEDYPLHPVLPTKLDEWTGTNNKTQPTVLVYITFEGDVDHKDDPLIFTDETKSEALMPLHPSYVNDMMFSDTEWRPYIDYRFTGASDNPLSADKFSYTYLANSKETNRNTILTNVFGTLNPPPVNATNVAAFANGIYHGSVAHFINYTSKERSSVKPALDLSGRGGIVTIVLPKNFAQPYDTGNVGQTIGRPNGPDNNSAANTRLRTETIKYFLAQMDVRQLPGATYNAGNNTWVLRVRDLSIATMLTGYSYELSAERNVLNELVGVWGNSAGGITTTSADLPAWYDGASVQIGGIYQMCSHALDESRALPGNNPANISVPRLTGIWPTRPRQFVVYAHEFSHNSLGAHDETPGKTGANIHSDVYDTSAQTRNQSAAELWPIFLSGDVISGDRIVILSRDSTLTDIDAAREDTRNWFPGTRYAAAFGNWGTQGVGGYIGADDEDVAARGGAHDGWNMIERNRINAPRTLTTSSTDVRLEYGDIIRIMVAPPFNNTNFFDTYGGTTTGINNQTFYLSVRENSGYDKGVFDWARTHLTALGADPAFEGNKTGDDRYSVRKLIPRGDGLTFPLGGLQTSGLRENETAFSDARGGLHISHLDVLYSQSSGTGANASATYGFPLVTVEAHAYPSGIYTSGDAYTPNYGAGTYPFLGKYPDINRIAIDPAYTAGLNTNQGRIKTSLPATQHLLERYMVDRARGEYVSNDVRFNMGDPADLFNQWGVDEFVNPRLYSGDSRVQFGTNPPPGVGTGTRLIMARSADVIQAMDRQRHPTGPVAPFAITNIAYYDSSVPGYVDSGNGRSYVMFDFAITVVPQINIGKTNIDLIGATDTLSAAVSPDTYPGDKTIVWTSSNPAVATVNPTTGGAVTVTRVAPGYTTIRATLLADSSIYAECNVYAPIIPTGIVFAPAMTTTSIDVGASRDLAVVVSPVAAASKDVTWTSSNPAVLTVTPTGPYTAEIEALAGGTAVITVSSDVAPGVAAIATVTVIVPVTGVSVTPTSATILVGNTQLLSHSVTPTTATSPDVTWTSSNTAVATVSNTGTVTGVTVGNATITVTATYGGQTASCAVTVEPNTISVTGVTVAPTSVTLELGETQTLNETVIPSNATNTAVTWSNNGSAVASVSSGVVTAQAEGTATITVTTVDGAFQANCTVTVISGIVPTAPSYPTDAAAVAAAIGLDVSDLEAKDGKVYLGKSLADSLAKSLLGVDKVDTNIQPVFEGTVAPDGQTAQLSIMMTGKDLLASNPGDINLIGKTLIGGANFLDYVNNAGDFRDGKFTLRQGGAIYTGEIDPNATYELLVFIKDGGDFDLDGYVNGSFIASVFLASESTGGGGGGCSALGYLAFALLAVPFVLRRRS
ncbi:MAG: Ig-like domain-containing protein [Oscillospiraceae bacterium]|nr:Ig-like domain-containing protein [Oscillospiraceae bacterium]